MERIPGMIPKSDLHLTLVVKNKETGETITMQPHERVELEIQNNGDFKQSYVTCADGLDALFKTPEFANFNGF